MTEKSLRGFAAMDQAKQRAIASKGGKAAHAKGTAHEFTPEEAREAGKKGGQAAHAKGTAHEFTPEEAREAGRKGGQTTHTPQQAAPGPHQMGAPQHDPPVLQEKEMVQLEQPMM
ncbi:MAG TPA: KGG domain-containing protein [Gemmataceae bacterium]|nr:KGG domain-containing protein [Gemmataceae bacterium]